MRVRRARWDRAAMLVLALGGGIAAAQPPAGWNQWRGPSRDGRVAGLRAPQRWPAALDPGWKVEIGLGHSSPVVVGTAVYCFARQGEEEVIRRLDLATGKQTWSDRYAAPYTMHPAAVGHGPGPKSTPLCDGARVYTFGISGILSCLDAAKGTVIWRHDFKSEFPKTSPLYGHALSPLLDGGLLIVHAGGPDGGAIIAFDAGAGRERWRWPGDGPGYSSPIAITRNGVRQIVTQTQKLCVGISANDGTLLWSLPFRTPFDQNIFTPVAAGDRVIFGGSRQPTFACKIRKDGAVQRADKVWEASDATFYMNTPVLSGNRLYGFSERQSGQLVTLDATSGRIEWSGEARFALNAQVLDAGGLLLALTTDGDLSVYRKDGPALAQLARYHVADSPTWATPAVVGNRILVKDLNHLTEWRIPR